MPDLDELFDQATRPVEAAPGALARQHSRQQRRRRVQRASVFSIAAAIALVFMVGFWALSARDDTHQPADDHTIVPPRDLGPRGLFSVDLATGTVGQRLVANVSSVRPDISPDGNQLAFVRNVNGHEQIFTASIDGHHVTQITGLDGQAPCACGATDPDWSPDGATIVFVGSTLDGRHDLYTIDVATGSIERLTTSSAIESSPEWSHDATRIVFSRGFSTRESTALWVLTLATGRSEEVTSDVGGQQPSWSPDDRTIAFAGEDPSDDGTDIWLIGADGSGLRRLIDVARDDLSPAWSPDGSQIAFAAFLSDADPVISQIVLVDARVMPDGGAPSTKFLVDDLTDPTWDPTGLTIVGRRS